MIRILCCFVLLLVVPGGTARCTGQVVAPASSDALAPLHFLEGTWTAQGTGQGAASRGTYTFQRELGGHVLARHARTADCKGPADFDCAHGDLLYVFTDGPGQPPKAIYFDSEGHVIHYNVTLPDPATAVFLSPESANGPQFRLMYSLKDGVMTGSFAMHLPGPGEWHPYLTWTGKRQ